MNCLLHFLHVHNRVRPHPVYEGFDWLISLELIEVNISSELLGSVISHFPLLENLVLQHDAITK